MAYRKPLSRKQYGKKVRRGKRVHGKNYSKARLMKRGGIRL